MNIEIGKKYKALLFGSNMQTVHVVGIIEEQIVFKFYSRSGAKWRYEVYPSFGFRLMIKFAKDIAARDKL